MIFRAFLPGQSHYAGLLVAALIVISPADVPAGETTAKPVAGSERSAAAPKDPRAGDPAYEQARKLLGAIDEILAETAKNRGEARKLPSKHDFVFTPIWTETREDRERKIKRLLESALGIVTDVPIVDVQKSIEARRREILKLRDQIAKLKEKQLTAPKDAMLPGILTDTVDSLAEEIADLKKRIQGNRTDIDKSKGEIHKALQKSGVRMSREQLDLLLDSVLSGDLVKLVATFNAAKVIDEQLSELVHATGDNLSTARKYFAMHAALFAMLVHAQDSLIKKIDSKYMPRLEAIEHDIAKTRSETQRLLRGQNRADQRRALEANLQSQKFAARVARYYRRYLLRQREQLANARLRALRDLRIADNTYETVEASFQLKALIKDATASFEALRRLETPGFEQIFKNKELRKEFENLTRKLAPPSS